MTQSNTVLVARTFAAALTSSVVAQVRSSSGTSGESTQGAETGLDLAEDGAYVETTLTERSNLRKDIEP